MAKRMLIDASHPEETRVAIVEGNKLEDFDVESSTKQTIKGNIYLAKVVRIEPSLQAAFVDYGGNRHGFLAFSEIHPDYYRIPIEDREGLGETEHSENSEMLAPSSEGNEEKQALSSVESPSDQTNVLSEEIESGKGTSETQADDEALTAGVIEEIETLGGSQALDYDDRRKGTRPYKNYKIQEVLKKRQILLVQVMKEERGNKGAALTTYLSLAGRYCVLMPNTARGGGISRKITSVNDRKRLRTVIESLSIPEGMGVIIRTAGMERNKTEIKRDLEYLLKLWNDIRDTTLQSMAPALIHAEGALIKRALRDFYTSDIEEILVEGEEAYKDAKAFMRMLMSSHAKRVQLYKDPAISLFHRYHVETQIDSMHSPIANLPSGGYIVINPTEALVAIDVNSGRSTKERNIEETAYRTNLEAAEEVARQLRLRDLAGLVVVDFIDMEDARYNAAVERRLKEALKTDRARIQVGHISPFGLLELSRQRLRPSFLESSTSICSQCRGTGVVRATESTALHILRLLREEAMKEDVAELNAHLPTTVAFYILNQKRQALANLEAHFSVKILLACDDALVAPDCRIEKVKRLVAPGAEIEMTPSTPQKTGELNEQAQPKLEEPGDVQVSSGTSGRRNRFKRRRDRRPYQSTGTSEENANELSVAPEQKAASFPNDLHDKPSEDLENSLTSVGESLTSEQSSANQDELLHNRRRRGRRGGRRRSRHNGSTIVEEKLLDGNSDSIKADNEFLPPSPDKPQEVALDVKAVSLEGQLVSNEDKVSRPHRNRRPKSSVSESEIHLSSNVPSEKAVLHAVVESPEEKTLKRAHPKKGWWQRLLDS